MNPFNLNFVNLNYLELDINLQQMNYIVGIFYTALFIALLFFSPALSAIAIRLSLSIRWQLVLLGVCILYSISPILLTLGGMSLAERFGCEADGMGIIIYKCLETPWLGDVITLMTFAHWVIFLTIPSGVLGLIGFVTSLILKANRLRTGVNPSERPTAAFYRSRRRKVIAGVCAAIAQRWGLSFLGVRIATVVLTHLPHLKVSQFALYGQLSR